jgi:L-rhamnose mutarotase
LPASESHALLSAGETLAPPPQRHRLKGLATTMARYCFLLQVRPELLEEYRQRHAVVWPDMLTALNDSGWRNYSIFARPDGLLVGYVEADDLDAAQRAMAATEVNARWQAEMSKYFIGLDGRGPDESFLLLDEVFNLDDQLVRLHQRERDRR